MIEIYTVDAFTDELFKGNSAAVCTSFRDLSHSTNLDGLFQKIATELNLSETSFITQPQNSPSNVRYFLQWFSPTSEVDLCDHATSVIAHILVERMLKDSSINEFIFETKTVDELKLQKCEKQNDFQLHFPIDDPQPIEFDHQILEK